MSGEITPKEERARKEKSACLEVLAKSRISVLVGDAGTGKTTVLTALLMVRLVLLVTVIVARNLPIICELSFQLSKELHTLIPRRILMKKREKLLWNWHTH